MGTTMERDVIKIKPKLLSGMKKVQSWGALVRCSMLVFATMEME